MHLRITFGDRHRRVEIVSVRAKKLLTFSFIISSGTLILGWSDARIFLIAVKKVNDFCAEVFSSTFPLLNFFLL